MKILITGGTGFIARSLIPKLSINNEVLALGRIDLDLTKDQIVNNFFIHNKFDIVIHTAISGGNRIDKDMSDTFYNNLLMFENLIKHSNKFKFLINIGSGAEYSRTRSISDLDESLIGKCTPVDYYGLSKYIINERIKSISNTVNLRVFNVFGELEEPFRMIKNNINKYIQYEKMEIYENKHMSFFGIDDLYKVIDYIIDNYKNLKYKDYNICYNKSPSLIDVCNLINGLDDHTVQIVTQQKHKSNSYYGSNKRLKELDINFDGLKLSIEKMYKQIKKIT